MDALLTAFGHSRAFGPPIEELVTDRAALMALPPPDRAAIAHAGDPRLGDRDLEATLTHLCRCGLAAPSGNGSPPAAGATLLP